MIITKEQIKSTGATFTPTLLADFLASRIARYITNKSCQKVLDPACGEGELLVSMGEKLSEKGVSFQTTGYDANSKYLDFAKQRMLHAGIEQSNLIKDDFLQVVDISNAQISMDFETLSKSLINNSFDIVIANPPYVRTQILGTEQAQILAKKFNLKGRVDLYYPFLMAMTESLKNGGILGVITSNRYLFTKSGESIRKYLSENYEILELIDLGDTKLFDAAVLPAIFIGKKACPKKPSKAKFLKIYEELNGYTGNFISYNTIYELLNSEKSGYFKIGSKKFKKSEGYLNYSIGDNSAWEMLSTNENDWVSKIEKASKFKVEDFFKVRVGIKTTADKIFITDKWDELEIKPEDELLKDLLSQENIEPWGASDNLKLKVLYPHYSINGIKQTIDLDKYPNAKKYFTLHQEKLRSRKYLIDAGRNWYEMWVPHKPDLWALPKLVFPDISLSPRFYFDEGGKIVNGNCYWIVAENKNDIDKLLLIQGIANSKLMTKYHDLVFNNKLYSGRRRYFTQYVEKYPLPDYTSDTALQIIQLVKMLNENSDSSTIKELEYKLELKVAEAFKVSPIFDLF